MKNPIWKRLFWFILPLILTAIVYDTQRLYAETLRGKIHVLWPYLTELKLFGIWTNGQLLTPNQAIQSILNPVLDIYCGIFYVVFIPLHILIFAYQRFWLSFTTKNLILKEKLSLYGPSFTWSFFLVNAIGYSTYYWFAAAPPWYVDLYGLAEPANALAAASPARCIRFDNLVGLPIFQNMYSKSANVFGAIPSLHVAYPLLNALYGFKLKNLRAFSVIFYLSVCFAAIYLNHHYIIDLLWGSAYAIAVFFGLTKFMELKMSRIKNS